MKTPITDAAIRTHYDDERNRGAFNCVSPEDMRDLEERYNKAVAALELILEVQATGNVLPIADRVLYELGEQE